MIAPMLATESKADSLAHFIDDDEWVMQQKLDGHRVLMVSPGDDVPPTFLTRGGNLYTKRIPQALKDFRFPKGTGYGEVVLDGELMGDTFWVFDVLGVAAMLNQVQRRAFLESYFDGIVKHNLNPPFKIIPEAKTREQKIALAETALKSNFEGLILKRKHSQYHPGMRTAEWLKIKFVRTADVFVMAVRDDGKDSVKLGLIKWIGPGIMHDSYEVVEVGRASLIGKEKNSPINVGDVLEVKFLYVNEKNRRLYQPTILHKRDDKSMHECTVDQLDAHITNKSVLEEIRVPLGVE